MFTRPLGNFSLLFPPNHKICETTAMHSRQIYSLSLLCHVYNHLILLKQKNNTKREYVQKSMIILAFFYLEYFTHHTFQCTNIFCLVFEDLVVRVTFELKLQKEYTLFWYIFSLVDYIDLKQSNDK